MWPVGLDIQPEMLRDNREVLRLDEGWNNITAATQAILITYITIILHVYSQKTRGVCFRELSCFLVSMYLAWKYFVKTLFLRPLLETGPPFYALIRATRRATRL